MNKLPILIVEAHSRCNCRCVMCDIWRTTEGRTFSVEQLEAQLGSIDELGVQHVVFTGGEPLMNPQLFDLCRPLRTRGIRLTLLSTGLLLERYAQQVSEHFDEVIVSLDGPREVHDAIRRVPGAYDLLARGLAALGDVPLSARCVVQLQNYARLTDTAEAAALVGLRSISFLAVDTASDAFGHAEFPILDPQLSLDRNQLCDLEAQVGRLKQLPIVADSPAHLDRIVDLFRARLSLAAPHAPRCNAPWVSAYLRADGAVQPCFFHQAFGSTQQGSLASVLQSERATGFRETLDVATNPICRRCVCSLYRP